MDKRTLIPATRHRRLLAAHAALALACVAALVSTGCLGRSPQVRYFMLGTGAVEAAEAGAPDVSVLVGPVRLPAYLARPEFARLAKDGEIELDASDRWLGSFEESFLRATSLGVAKRLGSGEVVTHPSKAPFPIEYTVRLHVDDLIVEAGGEMRVRIRWALVGPAGPGRAPDQTQAECLGLGVWGRPEAPNGYSAQPAL